ncbi:hypothetical protein ACQP1G_03395 [Nocardia sp. CA-107356]|uniref:hypothetical protein n=1 Tax=Nocardia sp. CA-107356 TaxID=3239972 RepID=UPI003D8D7A4E
MSRKPLCTTQVPGKVAFWQLADRTARILRVQLTNEAFVAYRIPSRTELPGAQPGTIVFDAYPDLADARELLPQHGDLWDAVREDYWVAVLTMADHPSPGIGG